MTIQVNFTNAFSTLVLSLSLVACGGGSDAPEPPPAPTFPKTLSFEALDGRAGQLSLGIAPSHDTSYLGRSYAVGFYRVYQTNEDAAATKALFQDPTKYTIPSGESAPLFLTQADYFSSRTLVAFDIYNAELQFARFRVTGVTELADRVEATIEACSTRSRSNIQDTQAAVQVGFFAIPKTTKPVVILPLQFSQLWKTFNGLSIGACSENQ